MHFVTGAFLAGSAAVAAPLLIHLLSKRKRIHVPWGAMQFLMGTPPRPRRGFLRPRNLLLLALRMGVILLLALAFAQPQIVPPWRTSARDSAGGESLLILDVSLSTARKTDDGRTALAHPMAALRATLRALPDSHRVALLLASSTPRWAIGSPLPLSASNRQAIGALLDSIASEPGGSDLCAALQEALRLPPTPETLSRQILVFSDQTERPWRVSDTARWQSLERLRRSLESPVRISVPEVRLSESALPNLSLTTLPEQREWISSQDEPALLLHVTNHSPKPAPEGTISFEVDGRIVGKTRHASLAPHASQRIEYVLPPLPAGIHRIRSALSAPDSLLADNECQTILTCMEPVPILVLDGANPSQEALSPELRFLLAALGNPRPLSGTPHFSITIRPLAALDTLELHPFSAILLSHPRTLSSGQAARLSSYAAAGGGIWFALRQEAGVWDSQWAEPAMRMGLIPPLASPSTSLNPPAEGWRLLPPAREHPIGAMLAEGSGLDLDRARVQRHTLFQDPLPVSWRTVLSLENGSPVLLEQSFGGGRILVQSIAFDRSDNNLPALQCYVPILLESLDLLAHQRRPRRNLNLGEPFREASGAPSEGDAVAWIHSPDGKRRRVQARGGELLFASTDMPGLYRVGAEGEPDRWFYVRREQAESDLAPWSTETRETLAKGGLELPGHAGAEVPSTAPRAPVSGIGTAVSLTWVCFGLAVLLGCAEAWVACALSKRRMQIPEPVAFRPLSPR
jgi:hypothetical protein